MVGPSFFNAFLRTRGLSGRAALVQLHKLSGNAVLAYECSPELAAAGQFFPVEKGKPE